MVKKEAHPSHHEHHAQSPSHANEHSVPRLEETLLHNLVELQKVHTQLAEKFDKLANQIAQLLNLFEGAARNFVRQAPGTASDKDREFLDKIDKLLEQNKTIAKGLTLMEDRMRERVYGQVMQPSPRPPEAPRPLPRL